MFQIPFNRFYPIKYEQITAILHKPPMMRLYSLGIYPDNQVPGMINCYLTEQFSSQEFVERASNFTFSLFSLFPIIILFCNFLSKGAATVTPTNL